MSARLKIVLVVVGFLAVMGAVAFIPISRSSSTTLDASNLPAQAIVFGGQLNLESLDSQSCAPPLKRALVSYTQQESSTSETELGPIKVKWKGSEKWVRHSGQRNNPPRSEYEFFFSPPKGVNRVTISQQVYRNTRGRAALFEFKDITGMKLPVSKRVGKAEVTLLSAQTTKYEKPKGNLYTSYNGDSEMKPGTMCFTIKIKARLPEGFVREVVEGEGPYMELTDDSGKEYEPLITASDNASVIRSDPSKAYDYDAPDVVEATGKMVEVNDTYVFAPISPKPLTFSIGGCTPPGKNDIAWITFKNVPIK